MCINHVTLLLRYERFRLPWDGFEVDDMVNDGRKHFEPTTSNQMFVRVRTSTLTAAIGRGAPTATGEGADLRPSFPLWCTQPATCVNKGQTSGGSGSSSGSASGSGSGSGSGEVEGEGDEGVVAKKRRNRRLNAHTPGSAKSFTEDEIAEDDQRYAFGEGEEEEEEANAEDTDDRELLAAVAAAVTPAARGKDGGKKRPSAPLPPPQTLSAGGGGDAATTPKTPRVMRVAPASGGAKSGQPAPRKKKFTDDEPTTTANVDDDDDVFELPNSQKNLPFD